MSKAGDVPGDVDENGSDPWFPVFSVINILHPPLMPHEECLPLVRACKWQLKRTMFPKWVFVMNLFFCHPCFWISVSNERTFLLKLKKEMPSPYRTVPILPSWTKLLLHSFMCPTEMTHSQCSLHLPTLGVFLLGTLYVSRAQLPAQSLAVWINFDLIWLQLHLAAYSTD